LRLPRGCLTLRSPYLILPTRPTRSWFDEVGGGAIPWPEGTPTGLGPVLPREVVMDR
jgi:hypothetical protein